MRSKYFLVWIFLGIGSIVTILLNICFGSVSISFDEILRILFSNDLSESPNEIIIRHSRLPSALMAWIAGAALSVSGLQMQTLFRNPVAGPYILGISSGASLGVAILFLSGITFGSSLILSDTAILLSAALGASFVFLLILVISLRVKDMTILLVIGLMIAGTIGAVISIFQSIGSKEGLQLFVFWSFGSFKNAGQDKLFLLTPFVVIGFVIALTQIKSLNALLLGELTAKNLGVHVNKTKFWNITGTCLLAGSITAFCGPVAFIGLAVPHLSRMLFRTSDHKVLLPSSILIGASVAGICNFIAAAPWASWSLPLNAVTSLMGAPFVVWILLKIKNIRSYG